jgi:hypothetical protein
MIKESLALQLGQPFIQSPVPLIMNKIAMGAYCHIFYIGFIIAFFYYTSWHSLSPVEDSRIMVWDVPPVCPPIAETGYQYIRIIK